MEPLGLPSQPRQPVVEEEDLEEQEIIEVGPVLDELQEEENVVTHCHSLAAGAHLSQALWCGCGCQAIPGPGPPFLKASVSSIPRVIFICPLGRTPFSGGSFSRCFILYLIFFPLGFFLSLSFFFFGHTSRLAGS